MWWDIPIIPFVPVSKDSKMDKQEFVEVTLRANITSKAKDLGSIVKKTVRKYIHGSIEDLLVWKNEMEEVMRSKLVSDPVLKFGMVELLLSRDPLATFREIRMNVCMPVSVDEDSEPVENEGTFSSTMRCFYHHYFPALGNSARHQKKYLTQFLRKSRGVQIKQMIAHLKQINSYLIHFPKPDNVMLDEASVVEAACNLSPTKWHNDMAKMVFDPTDHSLEELHTILKRIEMIEVTESLSITTSKKRKADDKSEKNPKGKNGFKKKQGKMSEDAPPCALCTIFGGNASSHGTSCCNKKKHFSKMLSRPEKGFKNKSWKRSEELNSMIAKQTKKQVMSILKKRGIEDGSDSGSETE